MTQKQFTAFTDTLNTPNFGIYFAYNENYLIDIKAIFGTTIHFSNFLYDTNDNITQYTISGNGAPYGKTTLIKYTYDYTKTMPQSFDLKFSIAGIRFWYAGGVNVISLMGMNVGKGNKNWLLEMKQLEQTTGNTLNVFKYHYTTDSYNDISKRDVILNDTVSVFYNYIYE
ncbi:MAG: hypothetical protein IPK18_05185 [Sphingobacteriales bacterium]|nr:MAG: hypothetical protein IPK18_05185 [Sphingobacteriales bacterium]